MPNSIATNTKHATFHMRANQMLTRITPLGYCADTNYSCHGFGTCLYKGAPPSDYSICCCLFGVWSPGLAFSQDSVDIGRVQRLRQSIDWEAQSVVWGSRGAFSQVAVALRLPHSHKFAAQSIDCAGVRAFLSPGEKVDLLSPSVGGATVHRIPQPRGTI
jgi:hypothetical protein